MRAPHAPLHRISTLRTYAIRYRDLDHSRKSRDTELRRYFFTRSYAKRKALKLFFVGGLSTIVVASSGLVYIRNSNVFEHAVQKAKNRLADIGYSVSSNIKEYLPTEKEEVGSEYGFSRILPVQFSIPWKGLSFLRSPFSVDEISSALSTWSWPASLATVKDKTSALLLELGRGPGSLYSQLVYDAPDPNINPECAWDAEVRLGDDLCLSERAFLRDRRRKMKSSFAKLFGVLESEIDDRDVPIVALACSGGGFRAMINTTGSLVGASKSGLLDCVTYTSGISGSCWALGALYSGVAGSFDPVAAAQHLRKRITTSYLDMSTLDMLITSPTNKYLLAGLLRKANAQLGSVSLTDLYGTLLSARLFVPENTADIDFTRLSLFHFQRAIRDASLPLPIFTAISREIPSSLEKPLAQTIEKGRVSVDADRKYAVRREEQEIAQQIPWLWFEFTPFEVGCDELGAWIPSWSLGRRFEYGKSTEHIPEVSFSILSGIFGSAFCASLHYYVIEIQPILRQLPSQLYQWINDIISEQDLDVIHPVVPNELPNFVKGLDGYLKRNSPQGITERDYLGFMDAGAELNIPYYPLFRRDVDCIVALDASADSQDLWFTRAEEYALKRGLRTWPKGARWPALIESTKSAGGNTSKIGASPSSSESSEIPEESVTRKLAESQETEASEQEKKVESGEAKPLNMDEHLITPSSPTRTRNLKASTIWIGSSTGPDKDEVSSMMDELEEQDLLKRDGIAIVYNPLIPNDNAVPNFDPMEISTWAMSMTEDETSKLLSVAEANFIEGQEKIKKLLWIIWQRKKATRLSHEIRTESQLVLEHPW
ncbi:FabD/lysophospholipase-like protein [Schizopora paradoxa]|uniref:Lysophospholipase n=1 Tax=Schizopora paradoxa TaxID=27342 RepID=A0A0H2S5H7_9AGAM|nr:FabD/lysophospholipase-like protein [Schizopora paradoxa]